MRRVEPISISVERARIIVQGAVQGVGFRPFVFRLANELRLKGWVSNTSQGVVIEIEGDRASINVFLRRLKDERPPNSAIAKIEISFLPMTGYQSFEIRHSQETGEKTVRVLSDLAICSECLKEIFDPRNRRYQYPFTNCTHCGPRFSIIESLPYDRNNTTMRGFKMCDACQQEYDDPRDRRFHAQPNACPSCGPHLELWDSKGDAIAAREEALEKAALAITEGKIVAVKGLGGFHLIVDARNQQAVYLLRERKRRPHKPFAVMFPDLESVAEECVLSNKERRLLSTPASPIVLLKKRSMESKIAPSVAPANPFLGVMIPYTPLHALLLNRLGFPVVATSGNLSEEPICFDEKDAVGRLGSIADLFLVHNRPIVRPMDDSVVKIVVGRPLILRGARGMAPAIISMDHEASSVLAVGGHLKNTIAVTAGNSVVVSQHIGDLESQPSHDAFLKAEKSLKELYETNPQAVACDLHSDYFSTRYAESIGLPTVRVQHHHAHIVSCMAEHNLQGEVLGISWDGSGYGPDGTIWGGEFLLATRSTYKRVGCLRPFLLPGGDTAVKEPRRSALGVFYELFGGALFDDPSLPPMQSFSKRELWVLRSMLSKRINTPQTSSVGRLFDAVASTIGLQDKTSFEGQAAMALEYAIDPQRDKETYAVLVEKKDGLLVIDWGLMMLEILEDVRCHVPGGTISARFHNALVESLVDVAEMLDQKRIVLSGGCFQNSYLLEKSVLRLKVEGFDVYWPEHLPPNDGGLSAGQAAAAASRLFLPTSHSGEARRGINTPPSLPVALHGEEKCV